MGKISQRLEVQRAAVLCSGENQPTPAGPAGCSPLLWGKSANAWRSSGLQSSAVGKISQRLEVQRAAVLCSGENQPTPGGPAGCSPLQWGKSANAWRSSGLQSSAVGKISQRLEVQQAAVLCSGENQPTPAGPAGCSPLQWGKSANACRSSGLQSSAVGKISYVVVLPTTRNSHFPEKNLLAGSHRRFPLWVGGVVGGGICCPSGGNTTI